MSTQADNHRQCFVLMPFAPNLRWIFEEIKKGGHAAGYAVRRADDIFSPGVVIEQVEEGIVEADAVVAVCTGKNPNVFFELGIARSFHDVVLVAESDKDLPFDVAHMRALTYQDDPASLTVQVERALRSLELNPQRILRHLGNEIVSERLIQARGDDVLYWVTNEGLARPIPDEDTAALYSRVGSIVTVSPARVASLPKGPAMDSVQRSSLRRRGTDLFAILNGHWHYLATVAPLYKYGFASMGEVPELTENERRTSRVLF
jgi:hypothetical protein